MKVGRGLAAAVAVVAAILALGVVGVGEADATVFCVPTFHPACPNSGGNVAEADLEKAMGLQATDGKADEIRVAAGVLTETASFEPGGGSGATFEPNGSDDLTIVGAGPGSSFLTSSGSGNVYLFNLNFNNTREITMRDLTLRIPASFDDNGGAALQMEADDALENVDIESRNPGADGVAMIGGGKFLDGRLFGAEGGSIGDGFRSNGAGSGEMRIERTTIEDASWGILVDTIKVITRIRRTAIIDPVAYGLRFTKGAFAVVDNSIITVDDGYAVSGETGNTETLIFTVRHTTIVDTGGVAKPVIDVGDDLSKAKGSINAVFSDVIIAGNEEPLRCESPETSTTLTMRYSYFFHAAETSGNCSIPTIQTVDAFGPAGPPQFAGPADFHLLSDSPAIDTGDPATVTLPTEDFDGAPRPIDGDGDGDARRDIGAYEYQPPAPEEPGEPGNGGGGPTTDTTPPQTRIVKGPGGKLAQGTAIFRFRSSEAGSTFRCKLDRRKVGKCRSPRRYKHLKPGRHVFRVWAVDAAGNKDPTASKRRFRVPS